MQGTKTIIGFGGTTLFASGLYFASCKAGSGAQLNDAACRSLVGIDETCVRSKQFLPKKMQTEDSRS